MRLSRFSLQFLLILLTLSLPSIGLDLKESIITAQKNNPELLASIKKVEAAQAQLLQAAGAFLPTLKAEAVTGKMYSQPQTLQFTIPPLPPQVVTTGFEAEIPTSYLDFTLVQPLYTGGKLLSSHGLAKKNYKITYDNYKKTLLEVNFNTTSSYFGVIKTQKLVELALQSQKMAEKHLDQVKTMYEVGSATKADMLRSQVQLANTAVTLTRAKNGLAIAKNTFNNVLGLPIETDLDLSAADLSPGSADIPTYEEVLKLAYENRPDWRQFILSVDMARDNISIARADLFPSVALLGTYKTAFTKYPDFTTDLRSWTAFISGSWTLFDLKTPGKILEAQANLEAAKSSETSLKNAIALDTKNTYLELRSAEETIDSTKKALSLAEENYNIAEVRNASGAATNLEVIDAQVALTQARIDNLQSQFDIKINQAKLNRAIGKEIF